MTELEAVNLMLTQAAGQDPANALEEGDETLARVRSILARVLKDALASPYPFNEDTISLLLQTDGTVKVPVGVYLWLELPEGYVVRDAKIWKSSESSHQIGRAFTNIKAALNLKIEQIGHTEANFVAWSAAEEYAMSKDAGSSRHAACLAKRNFWSKKMSLKYPAEISNDNPMFGFGITNGYIPPQYRIDCT